MTRVCFRYSVRSVWLAAKIAAAVSLVWLQALGDVVVTGSLDGSDTFNITALGEYHNSGIQPISREYETYAKITYDGGWKTGIKTSVVWPGQNGFFPVEASARVVVNRIGYAFGPALPTQLVIQGVLNGMVNIQGGGENFHDGALTIGNQSVVLESGELNFFGSGTYSVNRPFSVTVPVNQANGSYPVNFWFKSESYAQSVSVVADLSSTLEITAITLPNGTMPESAGYTMTFSDGVASPNILPGDYNQNHTVDAADYVLWRNGLGATYTQADYDVWRANFGKTAGSGAGSSSTAVPEPLSIWLFSAALLQLVWHRKRQAVQLATTNFGTAQRAEF